MITTKNGIFYVVIWFRDSVTGKEKRKWIKSGTSKREAERLERKLMTEKDEGTQPIYDKDTPTLKAYLEQWLDIMIKPPTRSLGTYTNYAYACKNISTFLGSHKVNKLTGKLISAYYQALSQQGLSNTTIRLFHRILRSALKQAVIWEIINKNPCDTISPPKPQKPKNNALNTEQALLLVEFATANRDYHARNASESCTAIMLGALCGMRRGEICGLRWSDVDFKTSRINISHSLSRKSLEFVNDSLYPYIKKSSKTALVLDKVKTESSATFIIIPQMVINYLKDLRVRINRNRLQLGPAYSNHNFVLCDDFGNPRDPNAVTKNLQYLIKRYNKVHSEQLPLISVHDLRHTAATVMFENQLDTKLISRQLRHANTNITENIYKHITEKLATKAADLMDSLAQK